MKKINIIIEKLKKPASNKAKVTALKIALFVLPSDCRTVTMIMICDF